MTITAERRRYKNPPIEEALVEFHFAAGQEWDLTIPGKLHERVKAEYPSSRQQKLMQALIQQQTEGGQPNVTVQEGIGRVQLLNADGTRLVSLGPNVLSVNTLRPYDSWSAFRPRVERALRAYAEVSETDQVSRVAIRYINRIAFPSSALTLNEHFICGPVSGPGLPSEVGGFLNRTEYVYPDGVRLIVTLASVEASEASSAFVLDLEVVWASSGTLGLDAALATIDDLHEREGVAFEALITDKTRTVFDA